MTAFKAIDDDNNGVITVEELEKFIADNKSTFKGKNA